MTLSWWVATVLQCQGFLGPQSALPGRMYLQRAGHFLGQGASGFVALVEMMAKEQGGWELTPSRRMTEFQEARLAARIGEHPCVPGWLLTTTTPGRASGKKQVELAAEVCFLLRLLCRVTCLDNSRFIGDNFYFNFQSYLVRWCLTWWGGVLPGQVVSYLVRCCLIWGIPIHDTSPNKSSL